MLRVSKADQWPPRAQDAPAGHQDLRSPGGCVVIRSGGCLPAKDYRRSGGDQPGGSGPPSGGSPALRLHLVLIPPGTRGLPHLHPGSATAGYVVSGQAELWHGAGLVQHSVVRAGDFIYIPPGTPHLAVNRGDVTSIAVVACPSHEGSVTVELPRHLAGLLSYPVGSDG
jgi:uncharacterized RmlC-like cupin family protein